MRRRTTPIRTIVVRPAKPRNPVMLAVVQRLATFAGRRHAADLHARERLQRMDLDQRVRELGEW
ncbi:hypothetical protein SAMN05444679_12415 [Variovorax sp. CF079]|uniref:hypothetical protein n=1 Tax=Variovorax sp. CF079 TaxID=1882774 RepID=UPI0008831605|nr:hypothetical protein [Variovorax sp. CF079]SDE51351.1 hypothetical protein SAMN05444679_12415 [Variovorax sp. CF079]